MEPICHACGKDGSLQKLDLRFGRHRQTLYVCPECAALWGIGAEDTELKLHLGDFYLPLSLDDDPEQQCPECGRSLAAIRLSGIAGCGNCYAVFTKEFRRLIGGAEDPQTHRGRIPRNLEQLRKVFQHQQLRRERLHRAIEAEDYEEAARLRDQEEPDGEF